MGRILFFTGGGRSGKSQRALEVGTALPGPRCFVATCPRIDTEMDDRIRRHQEARTGLGWDTVEAPLDLCETLAGLGGYSVILVDCLGLWVNNLMFTASEPPTEDDAACRAAAVLAVSRGLPGTVIFVSNEVGMGIVPADAVSRQFRDLLGRVNQRVAREADEVTLLCCGLPLRVKP